MVAEHGMNLTPIHALEGGGGGGSTEKLMTMNAATAPHQKNLMNLPVNPSLFNLNFC